MPRDELIDPDPNKPPFKGVVYAGPCLWRRHEITVWMRDSGMDRSGTERDNSKNMPQLRFA